MKVGDTIYFKTFAVDMMEIVKGSVLYTYNEYLLVIEDECEIPRVIEDRDMNTKEGYELWQSFYKIQNDIRELKAKEDEMYKKLRAIPKASKGGILE